MNPKTSKVRYSGLVICVIVFFIRKMAEKLSMKCRGSIPEKKGRDEAESFAARKMILGGEHQRARNAYNEKH